jgi:hypothetical protein
METKSHKGIVMNRDNILKELKLSDNMLAHRPMVRIVDFVLTFQQKKACNQCIWSFEHWKPVLKGTLFCEQVCGNQTAEGFSISRIVAPDWYCEDFKQKEEDANSN